MGKLRKRPIVGVVGSHTDEWADLSAPIGRYIAESGCHLLTGAGGGVMSAVSEAFTKCGDRDGLCIGIQPMEGHEGYGLLEEYYPNPHIELPIVTMLDNAAKGDIMPYSRNMVNIMTSNAIIALPGWHGTKNEVSLALQYRKPLVLFGPEDAFESFPEEPCRAETLDEIKGFLREALH